MLGGIAGFFSRRARRRAAIGLAVAAVGCAAPKLGDGPLYRAPGPPPPGRARVVVYIDGAHHGTTVERVGINGVPLAALAHARRGIGRACEFAARDVPAGRVLVHVGAREGATGRLEAAALPLIAEAGRTLFVRLEVGVVGAEEAHGAPPVARAEFHRLQAEADGEPAAIRRCRESRRELGLGADLFL